MEEWMIHCVTLLPLLLLLLLPESCMCTADWSSSRWPEKYKERHFISTVFEESLTSHLNILKKVTSFKSERLKEKEKFEEANKRWKEHKSCCTTWIYYSWRSTNSFLRKTCENEEGVARARRMARPRKWETTIVAPAGKFYFTFFLHHCLTEQRHWAWLFLSKCVHQMFEISFLGCFQIESWSSEVEGHQSKWTAMHGRVPGQMVRMELFVHPAKKHGKTINRLEQEN